MVRRSLRAISCHLVWRAKKQVGKGNPMAIKVGFESGREAAGAGQRLFAVVCFDECAKSLDRFAINFTFPTQFPSQLRQTLTFHNFFTLPCHLLSRFSIT